MLIEAQTDNSLQVTFQRDKAVQGRPQAIAMNWQDHGFNPAFIFDHIDSGEIFTTADAGDIFRRLQAFRHLRILRRLLLVIGQRVHFVTEFTGPQINQACSYLLELGFYIATFFQQTSDGQNVAFLVEQLVGDLHRLERDSGSGYHHRAHQADQQRNDNRAADCFFFTGHDVRASA